MGTNNQKEILRPFGRFKGELDGVYQTFYAASDKQGRFFIKHDPEFGPDAFVKANGWKEISRETFAKYEDTLYRRPANTTRHNHLGL